MKSVRTNPWVKAVASVLCILSFAAVITTFWPVTRLVDGGAYQPNGSQQAMERREEELAADYAYQAADLYQSCKLGDNPSLTPLDERIGDPNFFYTIKDSSGILLDASDQLGDYCERYEVQVTVTHHGSFQEFDRIYDSLQGRTDALQEFLAVHDIHQEDVNIRQIDMEDGRYRLYITYSDGSLSEDITVTGFLRAPLVNDPASRIYQELKEVTALYHFRDVYLAVLAAGLAVGLLTLLYLTWAAGRVRGDGAIALHWVDTHVPLELLLLLGFVCAGAAFAYLYEFIFTDLTLVTVLLVLGALACGGLGLACWLSLVRRGKAHTLKDSLLARHLLRPLRWCRRTLRAQGWTLRRLAEQLPLFWQAGLGFGGLCLLEGLTLLFLWDGGPGVVLFGWCLIKLLEAGILIWSVLAMRALQQGGYELARGNLDYQVPLDTLGWSFRTHGEHLNSIRSAIQAAVEDQMKAERMKTELITNVSHDIKTPLTSIVSYVDLLKQQEMPTAQAREYLEVLDRQSAKLKKLTEDLVEAAKATTGNVTVHLQPTDVNVLLTQSAGEYQERLQRKGLTLMLTPAPGNPRIAADSRLLGRVFENLCSNIEKYALAGTRVYLDCREEEGRVTITFRNISATPLNITAGELMERFVRGDVSRHTEGSGLGLSIARSLTQLQQGAFDLAIDGDLFKAILTFPRLEEPLQKPVETSL